MPNYEIRIKAKNSSLPKPSPRANYCTWRCPYCHGTGLNPYAKSAGERCPACHGSINWEADAGSETLSTCGRCAGTGRINYMGNWAPCTACRGSGKV